MDVENKFFLRHDSRKKKECNVKVEKKNKKKRKKGRNGYKKDDSNQSRII
jgi:hypothetical protein